VRNSFESLLEMATNVGRRSAAMMFVDRELAEPLAQRVEDADQLVSSLGPDALVACYFLPLNSWRSKLASWLTIAILSASGSRSNLRFQTSIAGL